MLHGEYQFRLLCLTTHLLKQSNEIANPNMKDLTNIVDTLPEPLRTALKLPVGARFYRCALQINPFEYLIRHKKPTPFESESDYNRAIIEKCLELKIEVIGVTDHYRVSGSLKLLKEAREAGIYAFGGFEAVTKDGVHFLCLFDESKDDSLTTFIGNCGIHDFDEISPIGDIDSSELLEKSKTWGAICIAAHVTNKGGLLTKLSGQTRVNVWRSPNLLACAIPKSISDLHDEGFRQILMNKDSEYKRHRPIAIVNAIDVIAPSDLDKEGAFCFIKMSNVSIEAFRQAFLDSESRIRLNSDSEPKPHIELVAMSWEGGFLRDTAIRFNSNLNAVVGGRGTGKSTMIESLRYVLALDPITEDARKAHEGVVRHVLKPGTKLSLVVRAHKPAKRDYLIERSVPNPPIVKDTSSGEVLSILPRDVLPGVEVYGQHEISELAKSPEKLTILLKRFVDNDPSRIDRKEELIIELKRSRKQITEGRSEIDSLEERMAVLPSLEETERHFRQSGLEERLKEKSLLVKEEHLLSELIERLNLYRAISENLSENLPIDTAFVSDKALSRLPNSNLLMEIKGILDSMSTQLNIVSNHYVKVLSDTESAISNINERWKKQRESIEKNYGEVLRELQKSEIDGAEFIQLRERIVRLLPLKEATRKLKRNLKEYITRRRKLLNEWEEIKAEEFRLFAKAARKASTGLRERVRIRVTMAGDRRPLEQVLREVGGNLAAIQRLNELDQLSLPDFVMHCQEGKDSLMTYYNFPSGAAEKISGADPDFFMRIEELELPATTQIELNTAAVGAPAVWQALDALSTGQKATAILLLLLQESEAPLVIDQPEDDLDNRFITESVVPIMRQEKQQRQFVVSTHNANIPVLGDAEQIFGLVASGEADEGQAKINPDHMGSIDSLPVQELVEEILEGGKDAFEMRRSKYGF